MKNIIFLTIILMLVSCQGINSPEQVVIGEEFELKFGQETIISDEGITVTFSKLLEDSRCPKGLQCVWAGNARVAIQLGGKESILNSYLEPGKTNISEYEVKLISVSPYPKHKVSIDKKDYRINIVINK